MAKVVEAGARDAGPLAGCPPRPVDAACGVRLAKRVEHPLSAGVLRDVRS